MGLWVWMLAVFAGCGSSGGVPAVPDPDLSAAELACDDDGDCRAVELGCCNHCNGGKVIAVATEHAARVRAEHRQQPCDISCTQRSCPPTGVQCRSGVCTLVER